MHVNLHVLSGSLRIWRDDSHEKAMAMCNPSTLGGVQLCQLQPEGQRWSCQLFNVLWMVWEQLEGLQGLSTFSKNPAGLLLYRIRFHWLLQTDRGAEVHRSSPQRALGRVCVSHILVHLSLRTPHCISDRRMVTTHKENTTWKISGRKFLSTLSQALHVSTFRH